MGKIGLIFIGLALVVCILVYIICSVAMANDTLNLIKIEISRSTSDKERKYWKKKLLVTYIKTIPFGCLLLKLAGVGKDNE